MTTNINKAFTDLEQSKKLAELLPIKSADMCYIKHASSDNPTWRFDDDIPPMILGNVPINEVNEETLPCWSLAALLNVLPYTLNLENLIDNNKTVGKQEKLWKCMLSFHLVYYESDWHDNPIDACYELILKLNELNLL